MAKPNRKRGTGGKSSLKKQRQKQKKTGSPALIKKVNELLPYARKLFQENAHLKSFATYEEVLSCVEVRQEMVLEALTPLEKILEYDGGVAFLTKWIRLLPGSGNALLYIKRGDLYLKSQRPEDAQKDYDVVLDRGTNTEEVHASLAAFHERSHRLDEALASIDVVCKLNPDNAGHQRQRAKIMSRLGRNEEALALYVSAREGARSPHDAFMAQIELAGLYDGLGIFDTAYDAYVKADELLGSSQNSQLQRTKKYEQDIDSIFDSLKVENAQRWCNSAASPLLVNERPQPLAFFIGHPRSGTTLIEQVLAAHSSVTTLDEVSSLRKVAQGVVGSSGRGLVNVLDSLTDAECARFTDYYIDHVKQLTSEDIQSLSMIDKHPSNLDILPVVMRLFPRARILMALRDPRDVIVSCMFQAFRPNGVTINYRQVERAFHHGAQVWGRWLKLREILEQPWYEIRYENVVEDFEGEVRKLISFMGLEWDDKVLEFHKKAAKRFVSTPSYAAVGERVSNKAVGRWKNYEQYLRPHMHLLEPVLEKLGYTE